MANINDFKIVNQKSKVIGKSLKYYKKDVDDFTIAQSGFYLLVLECITNEKDEQTLLDMIIDDKFNKDIYGEGNDDLGVDAVYIDDERKIIQLFNFKYRREFKEGDTTKQSDAYDAVRFLSAIADENTKSLASKTKSKIKEILERYASPEIYNTELIMVANVNNTLPNDSNIDRFKDLFSLSIKSVVLDDIVAYISDYPEDKRAQLVVDSSSVLTYEMDNYSTAKSFLVKLSIAELVRITCSNEAFRVDPSITCEKLEGSKLEMGLLFENVRGYLGDTSFNSNIISTLKNDSNKFFMYNNGITITASNITAKTINGNKKFNISLEGFQIVNGGQTIRSVYRFCEESFDADKLATAEVLVRLFQTEKDDELKNSIAEYTNSQNAINASDLKSVSLLQRQIEIFLDGKEISYIRKAGDVGTRSKGYSKEISMERLAQILYSYMGYPDRAANAKKKLFVDYYDAIFHKDLDLDKVNEIINLYYEIMEKYEKTNYRPYAQKYFVVIFMKSKALNRSVESLIELLEDTLSTFELDNNLADSRKVLKVSFKNLIEEKLK